MQATAGIALGQPGGKSAFEQFHPIVHDLDISVVTEQPVLLTGRQLSDNAKTLQMSQTFIDGSGRTPCFYDQRTCGGNGLRQQCLVYLER